MTRQWFQSVSLVEGREVIVATRTEISQSFSSRVHSPAIRYYNRRLWWPAEDYSFSREWAYYRMLARFGLSYLRARKVNFYINDNYHGLCNLLEAPEQEYVFYRDFPN